MITTYLCIYSSTTKILNFLFFLDLQCIDTIRQNILFLYCIVFPPFSLSIF